MLTELEVHNSRNVLLSLPVSGSSGSYKVRDITGLDPIKADVTSSKFANLDGEQFQAVRGGMRNIVLTLGFAPNYTSESVATLRQTLYTHFMPKSLIRMRFVSTHMPTVEIMGYVETCETPLFTQDPEVKVSILCPLPDFYAITNTVVNGASVSTMTETVVNYPGTVPAGFQFSLATNRVVDNFDLFVGMPGHVELFTLMYSIPSGVDYNISTVPRDKRVEFVDSLDVVTNALMYVTTTSVWAQLVPGLNHVYGLTPGAAVPWSLTYTARYGGL